MDASSDGGGAVRIAMWSGPRNISTAMMRSFGNRAECAVSDEPFYAAYLDATGLQHPQRDEILESQPRDPRAVVAQVTGPVPGGRPVWYQKHMTHHMLPGFDRAWIDGCANAFLIRAPEPVGDPVELFERVADRLGSAPPVVETRDVLHDPRGVLARLCGRLGIGFDEAMLGWPAGRRSGSSVTRACARPGARRRDGRLRPGA